MSLIRFEPFRYGPNGVVNRVHQDFDRLLESHFGGGNADAAVTDWTPAVDISEEDDRFVLHADVPGVDPKDIEITMEEGVLTLRGSRAHVSEEKRDKYRRVERASGQFYRRFSLPDSADADAVEARSTHGVLEVVIPKQARVQPRRISVRTD